MQSKPEKLFTFDQVADLSITQGAVFNGVGRKIIESCVGGYNGTIFAYGQTGSGKTFTMLGPSENSDNFEHELRGVIPRSFEYLFQLIQREREMHGEKVQFLTKCSFLEIYNEQIFDLLEEASPGLQLRENIKKGVFVDGLIEQAVNNAAEAYNVLSTGWMNRTVASTSMNRESSRSHAVFTLCIESKTLNNGVWTMKASHLNLVDLAGSERQKDTQTSGVRLKEAGSINKSLSVLGNVIMSLVDIAHGKTRHVPYRDSKLSFLLRDSLGGNAKTVIIACVHPGVKCFGETLSTLHFARRAKMIKNKAVVNEDAQGSVSHLQAEIKRLKEALQHFQSMPAGQMIQEGVTEETGETGEAESGSQWRKRFLQAMQLRQQAEQDKEYLEKKIAAIESRLTKLDNQLRSKDMVIKFRTNSLKTYQVAKKDRDLTGDEKDAIIENQRSELLALEEQLKAESGGGVYKLQHEKLKAENAWLKSRKSLSELDLHRAKELQNIFDEAQATKLKEVNGAAVITTPQEGSEKISSATLERQKAQVESLQKQIEQYKCDIQSSKESQEKEVIKLRSELDAWKTRYEEVAAVQKSQCISGQIEREERDRMHMETIKNLTPKKLPYNLRSKGGAVNSPSSKAPVFCLDDSGETDDIFSEKQPIAMYETLEEELKKIREENQSLHVKVEERDRVLVEKSSQVSKLQSESTQIQQILEKERCEWSVKAKEYSAQVEALSSDLSLRQDENQNLLGHKYDMNIMMTAIEKTNKDLRKEKESLLQERESCVSELSTKVLQLENEKVKLESQLRQRLHECEILKETESAAQMTATYLEDQLSEAEEKQAILERDSVEMQLKLQDRADKLSRAEERNSLLMSELEKAFDDAGDKDKELLQLVGEQRKMEMQFEGMREKLQQAEESAKTTGDELQKQKEELRRLHKAEKEQKEVYQSMTSRLCEMKVQLEESQHEQGVLREQACEAATREQALQATQAQLEEASSHDRKQCAEKEARISELEIEVQRKMAEYDNLQEDVNSALAENEMLKSDLQALQNKTEELTKEFEKVINDRELQKKLIASMELDFSAKETKYGKMEEEVRKSISEFEDKIGKITTEKDELRQELTKERSEFSTQHSSLATTLGETESELTNMRNLIGSQREQLEKLESRCEESQLIASHCEAEVQSKQEQLDGCRRNIDTLQAEQKELRLSFQANIRDRDAKSEELDQVRAALQSAEKRLRDANEQLDMSLMRTSSAEQREADIREEMETLNASKVTITSERDSLSIKLSAVQHRLEDASKKCTAAEEECERLRTVIKEKSQEAVVIQSVCDEMKEQNTKAQARITELVAENSQLGSHGNHQQKINLLNSRNKQISVMTERDLEGSFSEQRELVSRATQELHGSVVKRALEVQSCERESIEQSNTEPLDTRLPGTNLPGTNHPGTGSTPRPPSKTYSDPDSVFETFSSVSNTKASKLTSNQEQQACDQQEVTTQTLDTFHSAASVLDRYSLRDIHAVCDHSKDNNQTLMIRGDAGGTSPSLCPNDTKKPELVRNVEGGTSAGECQVSLFSIEESVVQSNQSHECLSSFQTERVPSSTPKGQDEYVYNKTTKDLSGFFVDDENVVSYNVPLGQIVTTPTRGDEVAPEQGVEDYGDPSSSLDSGMLPLPTDSLLERSCSEPSILHTPPHKHMRRSLSKVLLFNQHSHLASPDISQIVKALDIKIDAWKNYIDNKETSKSESQLFQAFDSPKGSILSRRHSMSKESDSENLQAKHGRTRSSFTMNFKMRAQRLRQSLRKSVMKRRSSKSSTSSSTDLCHYHSRETEV